MIGKVTAVGELKELFNDNEKYADPLKIRTIEVKWYEPRSGHNGIYTAVMGAGFELRNEWASHCILKEGDMICFEYDIYPLRYTDRDKRQVYAARLSISRYSLITNWDDLKHYEMRQT